MLIRGRRQISVLLAIALGLQVLALTWFWNSSTRLEEVGRLTNSTNVSPSSGYDDIDNYVHEYLINKLDDVFNNKDFNTNWRFTKLHFKQVNTDPSFYQKQRADFHLYDPRITLAVYLNQITKSSQTPGTLLTVPFSWEDWVDLSSLNDFLVWDETQRPTCEDVIDHGIFYNPLKAVQTPNHKIHEGVCVDNIDYTGHADRHLLPGFSIINDAGENFNFLEKMIQSRSYLLSTMPQPEKLVFLTETDEIFEVYVNHDIHSTMMKNNMFNDFVESQRSHSKRKSKTNVEFNPIVELEEFTKNIPPIIPDINFRSLLTSKNNYKLDIPKEKFRYHPHKLLDDLKLNYQNLTRAQKVFVENLERQVDADMQIVPKSFGEANLKDHEINGHQVENLGHHYDLHFFNGFISESKLNYFDNVPDKQKIVLHQMLHTWLHFTFNAGIITYPAHGTLLSWYWNSMVFPWDEDIDVILPIEDLSNLCMNYNNSLIIQSPTDGYNKYFLDCSSSLTVRQHGNGANNIDARFIDVDSGMYIDLTGLAVSGEPGMSNRTLDHYHLKELVHGKEDVDFYKLHDEHEIYNCRNFHFFSYEEISPMKLSMMEHGPAFTPSNIEQCLKSEYRDEALTELMFEHHLFVDDLQLWVSNQNILRAARKIDRTLPNTDEALMIFYQNNKQDIVKLLLSDDEILNELIQVSFQTKAHHLSKNLNNHLAREWDFDLGQDKHDYLETKKQYDNLMKEYLKHHSPMRKSTFDYKIEVEMLKLNMDLEFTRDEISKFT